MAQRMGIEHIDWVRMDFASLLPELQLGRIDAIAAGMFITPNANAWQPSPAPPPACAPP